MSKARYRIMDLGKSGYLALAVPGEHYTSAVIRMSRAPESYRPLVVAERNYWDSETRQFCRWGTKAKAIQACKQHAKQFGFEYDGGEA